MRVRGRAGPLAEPPTEIQNLRCLRSRRMRIVGLAPSQVAAERLYVCIYVRMHMCICITYVNVRMHMYVCATGA